MEKPAAFRIKASELMPLSARSNGAAAWRAAGHLGSIILCATFLWNLRATWWAVPLVPALGYLLAFLFTAEHEMAHQTAFRTRAGNYLMGHLAGFVIGLPYEYYRVFHWDHHRYTQDLEKDPELARPLPTSKLRLAWFWAGVPTWVDRARMLVAHGIHGRVTKRWVPAGKRALIAREARFYLLGYAAIAVVSIALQTTMALWLWVVPVMVGQWFLRPYLLAEHTGCKHSPNMLENTRTTYTNRIVRYFAWNMPFHVEHHAYPSVPFHALPQLNMILASHITHSVQGYPAATADVLRYVHGADRAGAENLWRADRASANAPHLQEQSLQMESK